jgi:hypothetical protein
VGVGTGVGVADTEVGGEAALEVAEAVSAATEAGTEGTTEAVTVGDIMAEDTLEGHIMTTIHTIIPVSRTEPPSALAGTVGVGVAGMVTVGVDMVGADNGNRLSWCNCPLSLWRAFG